MKLMLEQKNHKSDAILKVDRSVNCILERRAQAAGTLASFGPSAGGQLGPSGPNPDITSPGAAFLLPSLMNRPVDPSDAIG